MSAALPRQARCELIEAIDALAIKSLREANESQRENGTLAWRDFSDERMRAELSETRSAYITRGEPVSSIIFQLLANGDAEGLTHQAIAELLVNLTIQIDSDGHIEIIDPYSGYSLIHALAERKELIELFKLLRTPKFSPLEHSVGLTRESSFGKQPLAHAIDYGNRLFIAEMSPTLTQLACVKTTLERAINAIEHVLTANTSLDFVMLIYRLVTTHPEYLALPNGDPQKLSLAPPSRAIHLLLQNQWDDPEKTNETVAVFVKAGCVYEPTTTQVELETSFLVSKTADPARKKALITAGIWTHLSSISKQRVLFENRNTLLGIPIEQTRDHKTGADSYFQLAKAMLSTHLPSSELIELDLPSDINNLNDINHTVCTTVLRELESNDALRVIEVIFKIPAFNHFEKNADGTHFLHFATVFLNPSEYLKLIQIINEADSVSFKSLSAITDSNGDTPLHMAALHNDGALFLCISRAVTISTRLMTNSLSKTAWEIFVEASVEGAPTDPRETLNTLCCALKLPAGSPVSLIYRYWKNLGKKNYFDSALSQAISSAAEQCQLRGTGETETTEQGVDNLISKNKSALQFKLASCEGSIKDMLFSNQSLTDPAVRQLNAYQLLEMALHYAKKARSDPSLTTLYHFMIGSPGITTETTPFQMVIALFADNLAGFCQLSAANAYLVPLFEIAMGIAPRDALIAALDEKNTEGFKPVAIAVQCGNTRFIQACHPCSTAYQAVAPAVRGGFLNADEYAVTTLTAPAVCFAALHKIYQGYALDRISTLLNLILERPETNPWDRAATAAYFYSMGFRLDDEYTLPSPVQRLLTTPDSFKTGSTLKNMLKHPWLAAGAFQKLPNPAQRAVALCFFEAGQAPTFLALCGLRYAYYIDGLPRTRFSLLVSTINRYCPRMADTLKKPEDLTKLVGGETVLCRLENEELLAPVIMTIFHLLMFIPQFNPFQCNANGTHLLQQLAHKEDADYSIPLYLDLAEQRRPGDAAKLVAIHPRIEDSIVLMALRAQDFDLMSSLLMRVSHSERIRLWSKIHECLRENPSALDFMVSVFDAPLDRPMQTIKALWNGKPAHIAAATSSEDLFHCASADPDSMFGVNLEGKTPLHYLIDHLDNGLMAAWFKKYQSRDPEKTVDPFTVTGGFNPINYLMKIISLTMSRGIAIRTAKQLRITIRLFVENCDSIYVFKSISQNQGFMDLVMYLSDTQQLNEKSHWVKHLIKGYRHPEVESRQVQILDQGLELRSHSFFSAEIVHQGSEPALALD